MIMQVQLCEYFSLWLRFCLLLFEIFCLVYLFRIICMYQIKSYHFFFIFDCFTAPSFLFALALYMTANLIMVLELKFLLVQAIKICIEAASNVKEECEAFSSEKASLQYNYFLEEVLSTILKSLPQGNVLTLLDIYMWRKSCFTACLPLWGHYLVTICPFIMECR